VIKNQVKQMLKIMNYILLVLYKTALIRYY